MTYSGNPAASGLDAVRFWAQDTGATGLLSDGEITYLIAFTRQDPVVAPIEIAAVVADRIASKYAGEVTISSDGVNYSGEQLQQKYATLAIELRKQAIRLNGLGATPFVGNLGVDANFGIGMDDNPEGYAQSLPNFGGESTWQSPDWIGY